MPGDAGFRSWQGIMPYATPASLSSICFSFSVLFQVNLPFSSLNLVHSSLRVYSNKTYFLLQKEKKKNPTGKIDTFSLPWPKVLPLILLNLRSITSGKHKPSPFQISMCRSMRMNEGLCEPTSLKGRHCITVNSYLNYWRNIQNWLLMSITNLPTEEEIQTPDCQSGDYILWTPLVKKKSLKPKWKGTSQVLLILVQKNYRELTPGSVPLT